MNRLTKVCKNGFVTLDATAYGIDQTAIDTVIRNSEPVKVAVEKLYQYEQEEMKQITLVDMGFSVRTYNCLMRAHIQTLYDLSQCTITSLMNVRNLGRRSLYEIIEICKLYDVNIIAETKQALKERVEI